MFTFESKRKEKAIEKVINEKYNSYYRMALSYVKNEADAEDIVQEGAYKAIKNSDSLKEIDYAATWVYRIMMNEIFRTLGKSKDVSIEEEHIEEPSSEDSCADLDLKEALEKLSDKDRAIIQLKYYEGLTLEEIADILNENVSTIKSRLYRSLAKLRVELEEE